MSDGAAWDTIGKARENATAVRTCGTDRNLISLLKAIHSSSPRSIDDAGQALPAWMMFSTSFIPSPSA